MELLEVQYEQKVLSFLWRFVAVSYTHLTLPTIA